MIGDRIRGRRKALAMSQEELARRVGCTGATIWNIENGKFRHTLWIVEIADALHCSAHWLAGSLGAQPPSFNSGTIAATDQAPRKSRREATAEAIDRIWRSDTLNGKRGPARQWWREKLPKHRRTADV